MHCKVHNNQSEAELDRMSWQLRDVLESVRTRTLDGDGTEAKTDDTTISTIDIIAFWMYAPHNLSFADAFTGKQPRWDGEWCYCGYRGGREVISLTSGMHHSRQGRRWRFSMSIVDTRTTVKIVLWLLGQQQLRLNTTINLISGCLSHTNLYVWTETTYIQTY